MTEQTMTDEQWRETETAQATAAFMGVVLSTLFNFIGGEVGGLLTRIVTSVSRRQVESQIEERGLPNFLRELIDPDRDDALRGGMYLMAAISALEAFVEDITKAAIKADKTLIDDRAYERLRLPASGLFSNDDEKIQNLF